MNPYQAPKLEVLKYTLLDVRARDKRGITFIVEMQLENILGYEVADRFRWTPDELEVYDYWSIKAQDERGAIQVAEERGRQTGLRDGKLHKAREMARTMRDDGFDAATIMKYTGLSAQELVDLSA